MTLLEFIELYKEIIAVLTSLGAMAGGIIAYSKKKAQKEKVRNQVLENELKNAKLLIEENYKQERIRKEDLLQESVDNIINDMGDINKSIDAFSDMTSKKIEAEISKLKDDIDIVLRGVSDNSHNNSVLLEGLVDIVNIIKHESILPQNKSGKLIEDEISKLCDIKRNQELIAIRDRHLYCMRKKMSDEKQSDIDESSL